MLTWCPVCKPVALSNPASVLAKDVCQERFDTVDVERVLNFLNSISEEVVSWPDNREKEQIKTGFLPRSEGKGPRNTIGCVDGCNIEIKKPEESSHSYFNRKKFPSVVHQGICNDRNKLNRLLQPSASEALNHAGTVWHHHQQR
ncbi:hypothetical protein HPB52_000020 [Rhipicephalus sanguineus]|uniref:Uncharacterized protein n=1 Tax=Rhipicephalus sanguineus TaxID=34632 RepID=A0A9D4T685_RHISA|nr:hypothetical protein HPB52_000020 [Rhipicephalus sanguineus]